MGASALSGVFKQIIMAGLPCHPPAWGNSNLAAQGLVAECLSLHLWVYEFHHTHTGAH